MEGDSCVVTPPRHPPQPGFTSSSVRKMAPLPKTKANRMSCVPAFPLSVQARLFPFPELGLWDVKSKEAIGAVGDMAGPSLPSGWHRQGEDKLYAAAWIPNRQRRQEVSLLFIINIVLIIGCWWDKQLFAIKRATKKSSS